MLDSDLLHGEVNYLADLLGVSARTVKRYKADPAAMPEPCRRLLRLRRSGDLAALLGSAWDGFSFSAGGLLYVPGWSNGMRPEQIRAMFFVFQEAAALRLDVDALRRGHDARTAKALRDLVGLKVSNDGHAADQAHGDVLRPSHGSAGR